MSLTIEQVKSAFANWRLTKAHKERIPENLLNLVRQLLSNYKKRQICKELGLSGSQLKIISSSIQKKPLVADEIVTNDGFVTATLPILPWCELSIKGTTRTLTVKFPTEQLQQILPLMVAQL